MPDRTRAAGILAIVLALCVYAYAPVLSAGLLGEDYRTLLSLEEASDAGGIESLYGVEGTDARPGAAISLLGSRILWTEDGRWSGAEAFALRLENLLLLLVGALGLGGLMQRALRPWLGPDPAKSAGYAAAAMLLLHPLCVASVVRVASRGDLWVVALGAWAARLFLEGRQEMNYGFVVIAAVLTFLASLCSPLAVFLPLVLTGMEYLSARRHRPRHTRIRTATTTFLVFTTLALVEWGGRWAYAAEDALRTVLPAPASYGSVELFLEKLGVVLLPVDTYGIGATGYVFAGLILLFALQPGFVAARSAPRLWGRILLGWGLSLAAAFSPSAGRRVPPGSLEGAYVLLAAAVVMAIGFGIASTALSGWRRSLVPAVVCAVFAILGRAVAVPRRDAAGALAALRAELIDAARDRDWNTTLVLLDPPRLVAGVDIFDDGLEALLAPPFQPVPPDSERVPVLGISANAFRAWLREDEFTALRAEGLTLLADADLLDPHASPGRVAVDLPPPADGEERTNWRGKGISPAGVVLEALRARSFRVAAIAGTATDAPPVIRWAASGLVPNETEVTGVWLAGDDGPVAVFDLESCLPWLLGGLIRSTWFPGPLYSIVTAQVTPGPTELPVAPRPVDDDWLFDLSGIDLPEALSANDYWRLGLFDVVNLTYRELAPNLDEGGRLRFPDAGSWVEAAQRDGGGAVAWSLDRRVGGVTVARASARRAAPDETLEPADSGDSGSGAAGEE